MSVYRRGRIYWSVFEQGGRKYQFSTGFSNKTAALRVEAKRRADLLERRAGFTKLKQAPKFQDFVEEFLGWSKQEHKSKTHGLHQWNCKTLMHYFKGRYLDDISSADVEDFKSARKNDLRQGSKDQSTIKNATVNRALTTLKLMFHRAVRKGYAVKNPVVGVAMLTEPLDSMRVISLEEQVAYLSAASQPLLDTARVILGSGMRPEEAFRMRVENIDFKQRSIFIPFGKTKAARARSR